ncbi:hypothetical protein GCM10022240_05700 [Microbacterium kribbense]|uniref:HTH tetR-type domain-containing protein n=1 Tax=Microbacterium kribbense TaxID=433645 RepID=A0ABP7G4M5_9MICO
MTQAPVVREPKQQRTREAWNRVLDVGLALFIEGGLDGLTISEVCRRAEISAPSLYARVDGLAGLVAAVYEHAMVDLRRSDSAAFAGVRGSDARWPSASRPSLRLSPTISHATRICCGPSSRLPFAMIGCTTVASKRRNA